MVDLQAVILWFIRQKVRLVITAIPLRFTVCKFGQRCFAVPSPFYLILPLKAALQHHQPPSARLFSYHSWTAALKEFSTFLFLSSFVHFSEMNIIKAPCKTNWILLLLLFSQILFTGQSFLFAKETVGMKG